MKHKEKCNCWLGYFYGGDNLRLDDFVSLCIDNCEDSNRTIKMMNDIMGSNKKHIKPSDYLDRRKCYTVMFIFCPRCGTKIDWRKLRKRLSDSAFNSEVKE